VWKFTKCVSVSHTYVGFKQLTLNSFIWKVDELWHTLITINCIVYIASRKWNWYDVTVFVTHESPLYKLNKYAKTPCNPTVTVSSTRFQRTITMQSECIFSIHFAMQWQNTLAGNIRTLIKCKWAKFWQKRKATGYQQFVCLLLSFRLL